jgi:hypothetical protein
MRAINIEDGKTVFTDEPPTSDLTLLSQLRRSVELTAKDPRWLRINDRSPVIWEDQLVSWGSLTSAEKMNCDFNDAGLLEGSYPFDTMNDLEAP